MSSPAPRPPLEITIPSDLAEARRVQAEIETALRRVRSPTTTSSPSSSPSKRPWSTPSSTATRWTAPRQVRVAYRVRPSASRSRSPTRAPASTPSDVPDPTAPENLERPCGRGLLLMRHYMTEVGVHRPRQLAVHMAKVLQRGEVIVLDRRAGSRDRPCRSDSRRTARSGHATPLDRVPFVSMT